MKLGRLCLRISAPQDLLRSRETHPAVDVMHLLKWYIVIIAQHESEHFIMPLFCLPTMLPTLVSRLNTCHLDHQTLLPHLLLRQTSLLSCLCHIRVPLLRSLYTFEAAVIPQPLAIAVHDSTSDGLFLFVERLETIIAVTLVATCWCLRDGVGR